MYVLPAGERKEVQALSEVVLMSAGPLGHMSQETEEKRQQATAMENKRDLTSPIHKIQIKPATRRPQTRPIRHEVNAAIHSSANARPVVHIIRPLKRGDQRFPFVLEVSSVRAIVL